MSREFGGVLVKTVLQLLESNFTDAQKLNTVKITALFNNTRILKFKTQPTVSFFTAANVIVDASGNNDSLRKKVKRSCLWVVIGGL